MSNPTVPTLEDYGYDALHEFVEDVPDDEREQILNELYERQYSQFESLSIGESRVIQGGGAKVYRKGIDEYEIQFMSPTEELRYTLHQVINNVFN